MSDLWLEAQDLNHYSIMNLSFQHNISFIIDNFTEYNTLAQYNTLCLLQFEYASISQNDMTLKIV